MLELKLEAKAAVLPCSGFLFTPPQSEGTGSHTDGFLQPLPPKFGKVQRYGLGRLWEVNLMLLRT